MKNLFDTKDGKITEKAFLQGLIISVLGILLCVVALCSITYAWFTTDLTSGENVIESGNFALDIRVTDSKGDPVYVKDIADGTYSCTFESADLYTVVLEMTYDTTASKGYCEITINSTDKKQTNPISKDTSVGVNPFEFTIDVKSENTVVTFEPKWGISASAEIAHGGTVEVANVSAENGENDQSN